MRVVLRLTAEMLHAARNMQFKTNSMFIAKVVAAAAMVAPASSPLAATA